MLSPGGGTLLEGGNQVQVGGPLEVGSQGRWAVGVDSRAGVEMSNLHPDMVEGRPEYGIVDNSRENHLASITSH